jgi:hypothetical protein
MSARKDICMKQRGSGKWLEGINYPSIYVFRRIFYNVKLCVHIESETKESSVLRSIVSTAWFSRIFFLTLVRISHGLSNIMRRVESMS